MSHQSTQRSETYGSDAISLQKSLQNTQNELNVTRQKSLELTGVNNELQQQIREQYEINHTITANITDLQMKIELLEAQNQEYQHTINQTNDKYEEAMHELSLTREQLNIATHRLKENEHTMQSLNNDLLRIASNTPIKPHKNGHFKSNNSHSSNNTIDYKTKYEKQLLKYDELLKECDEYRNYYSQSIEQQIELENTKKHSIEFEQRSKQLSEQIVELTYENVHLEKEINDYTQEIDNKNELINYLQTENQNLTMKWTEKHQKTHEFKLNSPNFTSTSPTNKPVTTTHNDHKLMSSEKEFQESNHSNHNDNDIKDNIEYESENEIIEDANDLFTMVQNYENNDEYLDEIEAKHSEELPQFQLSNGTISGSPKHRPQSAHSNKNKLDAQEEYLHLTASAIKIKYPNVEASITELLQLCRNIAFYEAYDVLNEYMTKKKIKQEIEDAESENNLSPQPKGKVGRLLKRVRRGSVTVKDKIIMIQRSNNSKKSILDYDKFQKKLQEKKGRLKSAGVTVETVNEKQKEDKQKDKKKKNKVLKGKKNKNKKQKKLQEIIVIKNAEKNGEKVKDKKVKDKKVKKKKDKRRKSKHKNDKTDECKVIIT